MISATKSRRNRRVGENRFSATKSRRSRRMVVLFYATKNRRNRRDRGE